MSDEWCTPRPIAAAVGGWDLDPASNARSHILARFVCGPEHAGMAHCLGVDGLAADWTGLSVWLNFPYSDPMPWCAKLARHESPWCVLAKGDSTTRWYAVLKNACDGDAPFRHRLKFERPDKPPFTAQFPSHLFWSRWRPPAALRPHLWLASYNQEQP